MNGGLGGFLRGLGGSGGVLGQSWGLRAKHTDTYTHIWFSGSG